MNLTNSLRTTVLALAVTFAAGLLFVNVYNSVVDATHWGSNVPVSIESARAYFKAATPGTFFRVASPLNQILALAALLLGQVQVPVRDPAQHDRHSEERLHGWVVAREAD